MEGVLKLLDISGPVADNEGLHGIVIDVFGLLPVLRAQDLQEVFGEVRYVGSSFQFSLTDTDITSVEDFLKTCAERGVEIKWFGAKEPVAFTSSWESWQYVKDVQPLPKTRQILDYMCDFRIPLTFSIDDCKTVAAVIRQVAKEIFIKN